MQGDRKMLKHLKIRPLKDAIGARNDADATNIQNALTDSLVLLYCQEYEK